MRVSGEQQSKQRTSTWLYAYWNDLRDGRQAPERFEVQPAEIASLLPETFIAEVNSVEGDGAGLNGPFNYDFRLVGTRVCEQFGRELRGVNLLELWDAEDREAIETLLQGTVEDGSVSFVEFDAITGDGRKVRFELLVMPLVHASTRINRLMGCLSALEHPYWLGNTPLERLEITDAKIIWPDHQPHFLRADQIEELPQLAAARGSEKPRIVSKPGRTFRVYEGGRRG